MTGVTDGKPDSIKKTIKEVAYEQLSIGDAPKPKKRKVSLAYLDEKVSQQEKDLARVYRLVSEQDDGVKDALIPEMAKLNSKIMALAWVVKKVAPKDKNVQKVLKEIGFLGQ